jgi:hypothetical protein
MYKGKVFHIQTEDSGINNPHIITLLYRGGTIISSKKTSYADIIKVDNLEQVVEELMKDQHKDMLRNLKAGKFDERAFDSRSSGPQERTQDPLRATGAHRDPPPVPRQVPGETPRNTQSLDEIILDYLVRGEDT